MLFKLQKSILVYTIVNINVKNNIYSSVCYLTIIKHSTHSLPLSITNYTHIAKYLKILATDVIVTETVSIYKCFKKKVYFLRP